MVGSLSLAALAGLLSILSPCVLPLLPIVLTSAASKHRYGQLALALGLAGSFVAIGMFVATIGFGLGFDLAFFRSFAALMMIAFGLVLMAPSMQTRLAAAAGPVGNWAERRASAVSARRAGRGSSWLASCSVRSGALASDRRSARPRCWPRGGRTSVRSS